MLRRGFLLLFVSSVAFAQTPRVLFDEGAALYAKGDFANAALKFEASFAARPVPVTKFNIARSWEQAGETLKAIDAWQGWLVMSPTSPERPTAIQSLATLGAKLARLGVQAVTITSLPVGARVSVDGRPVGLTPVTVELTPTRHLLRVEADGRLPVERTVVTTLDQPVVEDFELAPDSEAAAAAAPLAVTQPVPLPAPTVPRPIDVAFGSSLADDTVLVHIEANNREVRLIRYSGNPNGECRTPCDAPVTRASDTFFIGGLGVPPSRAFVLADHAVGGRASLKVKAGSPGLVAAGTLLTTAGITGLSIALAFIITGVSRSSSLDGTLPIGLGLGLSGASLVGAVISFAASGTSVTFNADER